jgi:hypothetical protein
MNRMIIKQNRRASTMNRILLIATVVILSGCATKPKPKLATSRMSSTLSSGGLRLSILKVSAATPYYEITVTGNPYWAMESSTNLSDWTLLTDWRGWSNGVVKMCPGRRMFFRVYTSKQVDPTIYFFHP